MVKTLRGLSTPPESVYATNTKYMAIGTEVRKKEKLLALKMAALKISRDSILGRGMNRSTQFFAEKVLYQHHLLLAIHPMQALEVPPLACTTTTNTDICPLRGL